MKASKRRKSQWVAWVVLVLLVGAVVGVEDLPCGKVGPQDIGESGFAVFSEDIAISDFPENVKGGAAELDVGHLFDEPRVCDDHGRQRLARLENTTTTRFFGRGGIWYEGLITGLRTQVKVMRDMQRRTLAKVLESHSDRQSGLRGFYADRWYCTYPGALGVLHQPNGCIQRGGLSREGARLPAIDEDRHRGQEEGKIVHAIAGPFAARWQYWLAVFGGFVLLLLGCFLLDDARWLGREGYFLPWGLRRLVWGLLLVVAGFWLVYQGSPIL